MTPTGNPSDRTKRVSSALAPGETVPAAATALPVPAAAAAPVARLGRYEVHAELGRGGMGVVYRGLDPALDRPVALKLLAPSLAADDGFRARFLSEARSIARIEHPNVVRVYDVGEESGQPFFAMEFVQGQPIDQVVKHKGPLPVREALAIVRQAAEGLAAAQSQGIIHRDVKPSNLVLDAGGKVKVLDFGLAKLPGSGAKTATDVIMGTPEYMSPEQGRGDPPDHRSDIYALGATLYYLLAGAPPFCGDSALKIIQKQVHEPPPPINAKRDDVPEGVQALLASMLAKDPSDRPADHALLVRAIDAALVPGRTAWPGPFLSWMRAAFVAPGAVARNAVVETRLFPVLKHTGKIGLAMALMVVIVLKSPKLAVARIIQAPILLVLLSLVTWVLARIFRGRAGFQKTLAAETASAAYLPLVAVLPSGLGFVGVIAMLRARWQMMPVLGLSGLTRLIALVASSLFFLGLLS